MHPAPQRVRPGTRPPWHVFIIVGLVLLLVGARSIASLIIEFEWWKEVGQLETWQNLILYSVAPTAVAALIAFIVLWVAHARGLKHAGTGLREYPMYSRITTAALLLLGLVLARASLDTWTVVTYLGAARNPGEVAWRDPIFGRSLAFYFFELPLYAQLIGFITALAFFAAVVYIIPGRFLALSRRIQDVRGAAVEFTLDDLNLGEVLRAPMLRSLIALFLIAFAARMSLQRYGYLDDDHGFIVGIDYVAANISIPLLWLGIGGLVLAAVLAIMGRWKLMLAAVALVALRGVLPAIISVVYVKPNELSLQRPYIQHHIAGSRAAWGFDKRLTEVQHPAKLEAPIHPERNKPLLENVRLWDWRAFHDIITQIQALRQYYRFADTDVDRYMLDGRLRQVMLTPRELDIRQLPDARANWINGHFIYTHGYGVVMAEANRITPQGQPVLLIQDAPPRVDTKSLKLTRPEIYYGETVHEPVFVRTEQPEFDYPAGADNMQTRYEGKGGIPIGGFGIKLAAALAYADRNLLLTKLFNPDSRMLINRDVRKRLQKLASFIDWDPDPYLVITEDGRLVWMVDGYTSTWRHPYSRRVNIGDIGMINYIRNSVKATIDAYDGTVTMYIFEPSDPIVRAFQGMFPTLFKPASEMPAGLRAHVRYPELLFRAQTEMYRTFHMQDPEAFYNREDLWDLARNIYGQGGEAEPVPPMYIVGTVPGSSTPEFLLVQSFTPRGKDNMIGVMLARSDGEHLGQMIVLQLSKQSLIYGPLQIEARIGSDQVITKDLSLWNQQGSQVLRGHMLVLPIEDTFLYVEPIYIQAAQAKMPQLRKVALAMGNTLIYRDTYEEAIRDLGAGVTSPVEAPAATSPPSETSQTSGTPAAPSPTGTPPALSGGDPRVTTIRDHLRRYRELASEGKWAEAGRELEAVEKLVGR